jgi:hypothetical protein
MVMAPMSDNELYDRGTASLLASWAEHARVAAAVGGAE